MGRVRAKKGSVFRGRINNAGTASKTLLGVTTGEMSRTSRPVPVHPLHNEDTLQQEKFDLQRKIMLGEPGAMESYMEMHHDDTTIMPRAW